MALRHFYFFLFFTLSIYASPQDFKACQLKYQVSSLPIDTTQAFAVDKEYALYYSAKAPQKGLVKRDPFLGLNLVESPKPFKHLFKFYAKQTDHTAAVLPANVIEGELVSEQNGLNQLAIFSKPIQENALITGTCCGIVGLSTPMGIIDKEYIQHFLKSQEIAYADIGIRLKDAKGVLVSEVNPFFDNSPFLLNDKIVSMDKKPAVSASKLSQKILFSKPQSRHRFVIIREGKKLDFEAVFQKRVSGGLVPESFFDLFGMKLDEHLFVQEDNASLEIKKGDKLLSVMGREVKSLAQIRTYLSESKGSSEREIEILIRRNGFDFFLHFDKPNNSI